MLVYRQFFGGSSFLHLQSLLNNDTHNQYNTRANMRRIKVAMRFIGCLFLLAFFVTLSTASAAAEKMFNAETFTLGNGLKVIVIPNHRAPVVTHMMWYKFGAADEQPGKSGVAHFL